MMKLKTCLHPLAVLAAFTLPASAAVISAWDSTQHNETTETQPPAPWFQSANATTSRLSYHGSIAGAARASSLITSGWGAAIDLNNYVGFTVSAKPGYELQLTSLENSAIKSTSSASNPTSAQWGYRINTGSGYGSWNFSGTFALTTASGLGGAMRMWDFADFTTTGTVEFGLFAWGGTATPSRLTAVADMGASPTNLNGYEMVLNGELTAVPEPSSILLGSLASLFLLRRRR